MADLEATFGLDYTQFMRSVQLLRKEAKSAAGDVSGSFKTFSSVSDGVKEMAKAFGGMALGAGTVFSMVTGSIAAVEQYAAKYRDVGVALENAKRGQKEFGESIGRDLAGAYVQLRSAASGALGVINRVRNAVVNVRADIFAMKFGHAAEIDAAREADERSQLAGRTIKRENELRQLLEADRLRASGDEKGAAAIEERLKLRGRELEIEKELGVDGRRLVELERARTEQRLKQIDERLAKERAARDEERKSRDDEFALSRLQAAFRVAEADAAERIAGAQGERERVSARNLAVELRLRRETVELERKSGLTPEQRAFGLGTLGYIADQERERIEREERAASEKRGAEARAEVESFELQQRIGRLRLDGQATEALVLERRAELNERIAEMTKQQLSDETRATLMQRVRAAGLQSLAAELRAIGDEQSRVLDTQPGTRVLGAGLGAFAPGFFGSGSLGRPDTQRERAAQETLKAQREATKVLQEIAENTRGGAAARFGR